MLSTRNDDMFRAVLKTEDGKLLEEGLGCILRDEGAVNFTSDFVPLYPAGTRLTIERMFEGKPIHRFYGRVCLSERTLIRLGEVEDELLSGAEEVYCSHMAFPITLASQRDAQDKPRGLRRLLGGAAPQAAVYPALITAMTPQQFECRLIVKPEQSEDFTPGEMLTMTPLGSIPLPVSAARVERPCLFGETASCLCSLPDLSVVSRETLRAFLASYSRARSKLF